ncbi:MAG: PKD domain-containing protein, partial [Promethearchaeota archaeon]
NLGDGTYRVSLTPSEKAGIISPKDGSYVNGYIEIEWNGNFGTASLVYAEGACDGTVINSGSLVNYITSKGTYTWDDYPGDGKYCLKIISANDLYAEAEITIDNGNPTADFITIPETNFVIGEEITFDASSSIGDDIETYEWDFNNDGIIDGEGVSLTYVYSEPGDYDVVLTVTDYAGNQNTTMKRIEVSEPDYGENQLSYQTIVEEGLSESFDTGLTGVECSWVNPPEQEISLEEDGSNCILTWETEEGDEGTYNLAIRAKGDEGTKYYQVNIVVHTWKINLNEGWNLISIPLTPGDISIESVLGGIINDIAYDGGSTYTIYQYDATSETWNKARPLSDKSGFYGSLDKIVPGYAYWIKMENPAVLYGDKKKVEGPEVPIPSITLATGKWNLIGKYGLGNTNISTAFQLLEENYFADNILEFVENVWQKLTGEELEATKGYWLRTKIVEGKDTISYEPGTYYFD